MKTVICDSGLMGWQAHLRENYSSYEEFVVYCDMYQLHVRLGYKTPLDAWKDNPLCQGSTIPSDFRKVD